jgi:mannose-1-phosphate guanylyltransferase
LGVPGFGYIEQGAPVELRDGGAGGAEVRRVVRFREKPNAELAETFVRSGNFRWNAGMFVWSVPTVLSEFNRHTRELANFISQVSRRGNSRRRCATALPKLPKISFDYAIMEKADRVLVVEAAFDWDDVGSWQAVASYFDTDAAKNAAKCDLTAVDSSGNIVYDQVEQDRAARSAQPDHRADCGRAAGVPPPPGGEN